MSLINDALKQARKSPPRNVPSALQPMQPAAEEAPVAAWLLPGIVIILIVAAIFFIGWAVARHNVHTIVNDPESSQPAQPVVAVPLPVVTPRPVEPAPPLNPPDSPKLQGIFYSPKDPSAIIDGKTVRPGDQFGQYRVKSISKYSVTLIGADKKEIQIGMDD